MTLVSALSLWQSPITISMLQLISGILIGGAPLAAALFVFTWRVSWAVRGHRAEMEKQHAKFEVDHNALRSDMATALDAIRDSVGRLTAISERHDDTLTELSIQQRALMLSEQRFAAMYINPKGKP